MVKWFKRKIRNWLLQGEDVKQECIRLTASDEIGTLDSDPILNFKVYSAVGGKVVEFRHYDRQKDRSFNQTYIISNDQDFGERIAKIATMEVLKN